MGLINLLATQPGISFDQARAIGRRSLRELGRSFCEFAHVWSRPIDETMARISHIHGEQEYLDACASDRPVLLLSLHLGSWETMNPYLGRQGTTIMYQPHPATLVDELVKQARERSGCRLVPTNNQGIKHGLATLRTGGTLALLADHNPGNRSNPYAPFFGHAVPTPALVGKLVQRFRPRVFLVSCYRGEGGIKDMEMHFQPVPELENGADTHPLLRAMKQALAHCPQRHLRPDHSPLKPSTTGPRGGPGGGRFRALRHRLGRDRPAGKRAARASRKYMALRSRLSTCGWGVRAWTIVRHDRTTATPPASGCGLGAA